MGTCGIPGATPADHKPRTPRADPLRPRCQSHQSKQTRLHRSSKCVGSAALIGVGGDQITTGATALMRTTHATAITVTGVTVIIGDVQRRSKHSASFFLNC